MIEVNAKSETLDALNPSYDSNIDAMGHIMHGGRPRTVRYQGRGRIAS